MTYSYSRWLRVFPVSWYVFFSYPVSERIATDRDIGEQECSTLWEGEFFSAREREKKEKERITDICMLRYKELEEVVK